MILPKSILNYFNISEKIKKNKILASIVNSTIQDVHRTKSFIDQ